MDNSVDSSTVQYRGVLVRSRRAKLGFAFVVAVVLLVSAIFVSTGDVMGVALANASQDRLVQVRLRAAQEIKHNNVYKIVNADTGLVLTVYDRLQYDSARLVQDSDADQSHKRFRLESLGNGDYGMMAMHSARELMIDSGNVNNDNTVYVWKRYRTDNYVNRVFRLDPNVDGTYTIYAKSTNYTKKLVAASNQIGADILLSESGTYSRWNIVPVSYEGDQTIYQGSNKSIYNGGVYRIRHVSSGKYLDMKDYGLSREELTKIQALDVDTQCYTLDEELDAGVDINAQDNYTKDFGNSSTVVPTIYYRHNGFNQKFRLNYVGQDTFEIQPVHASGNRVLSVDGDVNADNVGLKQWGNLNNWGKNTSYKSQRFRFHVTAKGDNVFTISTALSNHVRYLNTRDASHSDGAVVVQSFKGSPDEWQLESDVDPDAVYRIGSNTQVMTVSNVANGASIDVKSLDRNDHNQLFYLQSVDLAGYSGEYYINLAVDQEYFALDVANDSSANNTPITVYTPNVSKAQKFRFDYPSYGGHSNFEIKTASSDFKMAIDINNDKAIQSDKLYYSGGYTTAKIWSLVRAVGYTLGGTYYENELPDPNLDEGSPWGIMKHVKDEYTEESRITRLIYQTSGVGTNTTRQNFKHRLVKYWKHSLKLDAPIRTYADEIILVGEKDVKLTSERYEADSYTEKKSIEFGMSFGDTNGIKLPSFLQSIFGDAKANISASFGYEDTTLVGQSAGITKTVTNDKDYNIYYKWQHRAIMEYYTVQVFEKEYHLVEKVTTSGTSITYDYNYTDLYKYRLVEQFKTWDIMNGGIYHGIMPYYIHIVGGFGDTFWIDVKDTSTIKYV